ncbi:kynureninase [Algirhabdus cladophorae]|uniref:kynureninase n=1 Tax=Algirhabdus cladophorae TaxID=3377108 RepID=UPI003B8450AA
MTDFAATKAQFHLPDGMIYLDGNSLGPLPKTAPAVVDAMMKQQWGDMLIGGWNKAGWMAQPTALGDQVARLIGAEAGHVTLGDTLSIKVVQALAAGLRLQPDRKVILTDNGNFPSDIYMAQGLIEALDQDYELCIVDPAEVAARIGPDVAVVLLTQVDYRTGAMHNMQSLTQTAHQSGALVIWDLAHSAGALDLDVSACNADFAVGCTYKYLNGGPGAPAFIYVAPRHIGQVEPMLSGWLGHAAPFDFAPDYRPGNGIERMRVGTPPVIQMASLAAALEIWKDVDLAQLRQASIDLSEQFIDLVEENCPMLRLVSPRNAAHRGSQVSFSFSEGYAAIQALIDRGVVGDFRAPNIMRFGITPLFIDADDITQACAIMADVMNNRLWDLPEYKVKSAVT